MELDVKLQIDALRHWLNSTTEYLFVKDLQGRYQCVSKATAILSGLNSSFDMIGKNDYEIYSKEIADKFVNEDKKVLQSKMQVYGETWITLPNTNEKILIAAIKAPLYDENENIIGIQGLSRNITDKYNLIKKVEEQKSQLKALFNTIPFAVWIKDKKGNYIAINNEYESFYKIKRKDVLRKNVMDILKTNQIITEETTQALMNSDNNVIQNKAIVCNEQIMHISGEDCYVSITKAPIIDDKGNVLGLLGISYDNTDRKNYENILRNSKKIAEEASRAKSEFLANMSHEIRTPMNGILGFIQLLGETKLDEEQQDYVNEVQKSSEILLALLNDILDLSKIEAGKMTMEDTSFNLRYVLEDVGTLASSNASKKGLEINVLCYSDVPENVLGDSNRLKQVLNNFVNNAIKFTHEGEINISAKLLSRDENKVKLEFLIEDTGIGISKENQEKIFESFTQADSSTTRKYGGTGLGLTISKNIIALMNGEIRVESTLGEGSKFIFTAEFGINKNCENTCVDNKIKSISGLKILLVDDNKTNLKVLSHYLKELNCITTCVNNANEALSILKTDKTYSLILTDFCMPNMDGIQFANELKTIENFKEIPVILLSSRAQMSDCKKNTTNSIKGFLAKPIRKKDLIECILLVMGKSSTKIITKEFINNNQKQLKLKILLVEDNKINQKLTSKMLAKLGLTCDIANNGQEALNAIDNNYDLILMDCQMPILDGYEATKRIRKIKKYKDIPIIALTANALESDFNDCLNVGMTDCLTKPLKFEKLIEKIELYSKEECSVEIENNIKIFDFEKEIENIIELTRVNLGIDKNDTLELLEDFFTEITTSLKELKEKIKENDYESICKISHSIKGSAGNLRINEIYELAKEIEDMGKKKNLENVNVKFKDIVQYVNGIKEKLIK